MPSDLAVAKPSTKGSISAYGSVGNHASLMLGNTYLML